MIEDQPATSEEDFTTPDLLRYRPVPSRDLSLLQKMSQQLKKAGVIGEGEEKIEALRPDASFSELFQEAARGAQYERELNSEFYHEELEVLAKERENSQVDWENPDLQEDGFAPASESLESFKERMEALALEEESEDQLEVLLRNYK